MNERQVMLETCKRGSRSGMRVDDAASFGLSDVDKTMHVCLARGLALSLDHVAFDVDVHNVFDGHLAIGQTRWGDRDEASHGVTKTDVSARAHGEPVRIHPLAKLDHLLALTTQLQRLHFP